MVCPSRYIRLARKDAKRVSIRSGGKKGGVENLWRKPAQSRQTKKILSSTHNAREERCRGSHSSNNGARARGRIDEGHRPTDRHLPFTSFLSSSSIPSSLHHHLTANNGCCAHASVAQNARGRRKEERVAVDNSRGRRREAPPRSPSAVLASSRLSP